MSGQVWNWYTGPVVAHVLRIHLDISKMLDQERRLDYPCVSKSSPPSKIRPVA
jgi:hypothetical protein